MVVATPGIACKPSGTHLPHKSPSFAVAAAVAHNVLSTSKHTACSSRTPQPTMEDYQQSCQQLIACCNIHKQQHCCSSAKFESCLRRSAVGLLNSGGLPPVAAAAGHTAGTAHLRLPPGLQDICAGLCTYAWKHAMSGISCMLVAGLCRRRVHQAHLLLPW
jgi:hypothetical protein